MLLTVSHFMLTQFSNWTAAEMWAGRYQCNRYWHPLTASSRT